MSQTYFLELLPGNLTDFHKTLHTASVDSTDKKVIKRIVIFQTILKLLSNNFLHILLKTQSVAYLHIGLSEWHETQVTTSPWATKAQNLSKAFTYVTPRGEVHFDASPKKTSTHYNFHIHFAIYSKLLRHVEGLALNTSAWHTPTAACADALGLRGPIYGCLQL